MNPTFNLMAPMACHEYILMWYIINPRRACAARVTVVVLSVCVHILFSDYRLRDGL